MKKITTYKLSEFGEEFFRKTKEKKEILRKKIEEKMNKSIEKMKRKRIDTELV